MTSIFNPFLQNDLMTNYKCFAGPFHRLIIVKVYSVWLVFHSAGKLSVERYDAA